MRWVAAAFFAAATLAVQAQHMADPQDLIAQQRAKMATLKAMDGVWRGTAWSLLPDGRKRYLRQTERIGPFLDGSVKVIEGRGYEDDGRLGFNALGVVYYDIAKQAYGLRSWAQGRNGDFKFEPRPDGYAWEVAFSGGSVRYVGTIAGNKLREVGHTILPGREPVQTFEMNLVRLGDTDWPLTRPVPQK